MDARSSTGQGIDRPIRRADQQRLGGDPAGQNVRQQHRETDHGYCKSVYATSPDGLIVEFTVDPPGVEKIEAIRRADAHSELARWMAGDHHVNNDLRPH